MCGIAGCWQTGGGRADDLRTLAGRMADALAHRGPDDAGVWMDAAAGLALGFRRLAIIDLSETGHQPMTSGNGRFVLIFNGEIYNFRELRAELERRHVTFRGTSDTEVIIEGVAAWGVKETLTRLWGMFALAIWDRDERQLWLARDRLGKKPLYLGRAPHAAGGVASWIFGSELKALRAHPTCPTSLDRSALAAFVRFGYVPTPWSIYDGIEKIPPGQLVRLTADGRRIDEPYWDARAALRPAGFPETATAPDAAPDVAINQLETLLADAVSRRLIADVPLGAFLSGGIDSSLIVALMQTASGRPVRTFTMGFPVDGYDEAAAARAVARHLGTDHTEVYVTAAAARDVIPRLPRLYDEPFADSSQIPTFLVAQLARQHVTVALTGDGGDEVFGGYVRHAWVDAVWTRSRGVPRPLRQSAEWLLRSLSPESWDRVGGFVEPALPARWRQRRPGEKLHKLADIVHAAHPREMYQRLVSLWPPDHRLVPGASARPSWADALTDGIALDSPARHMMFADLVGYLPDDVLVKVDRATMGVGLEARAPLLDHRVVEWAWRLPMALKIRHGEGKWILRQILHRHVPRALVDRPKAGFAVPVGDWLRGPLRAWGEALLDEPTLRRQGFFDPAPIRAAWTRHVAGAGREESRLWPILMFQAWLAEWS